ncbi:MAG TPA: AI-2E family transporter [Thermoanaerobaculia bacterium]|nr:AI-2E family transporter [Thermoanaerobaculia bacterium]
MDSRLRNPTLEPPRTTRRHPPETREPVHGWRSGDILRAAALVMGLYLLLRLLWLAHDLLFITFLGILFGLAVARGADWLERYRIPRGVGATLIVLSFVGLLVGIGAWAAPTLREQSGELQRMLPQALDRIEAWADSHRAGFLGQFIPGSAPAASTEGPAASPSPAGPPPTPPAEAPEGAGGSFSQLPKSLSGQLGAVTGYLFSFLSSTVAVVGGLLLILFIAIYVGAEPRLYHQGLLHLVPRSARPRADEVLGAVGMTLRRWLTSQLVLMVVIGVITGVGLSLLGVKSAVALGIIAGLLEFIPMLGPILAAVPAVAMGFLDSPQKALFVLLLYWGVQFLENHILVPILMKRGVDLPPVVTLIGLALMALVFGFLGMLVAVPFLAALMTAIKLLYVEDVVGDDVKTVLDSP